MSTLRTMQKTQVNDCYLLFPDKDNVRMPIARFKSVFALDDIPYCEVVPALGRELTKGVRMSLRSVEEGDAVQVWLKLNGENNLIIAGYVSMISGSDNATVFDRKLSAVLEIKHNIVKLSGAPASSFAYTTAIFGDTTPMSMVGSMHPLFASTQSTQTNLLAMGAFVTEIETRFGDAGIALYPASVLMHIASELMTSYATTDPGQRAAIQADVAALIKTYDPANLTFIPQASSLDLLFKFASKYVSLWQNSNNWQALVSTCKYLFLHTIPYNTGVYIGNPLSLLRTPTKQIRTREYTNIAQQVMASLSEPIDGVVLRSPTPNLENEKVIFPEPVQDARAKPRYYHFREYPDWVRAYLSLKRGPFTSKGVSEAERAAAQLSKNPDPAPRQTEQSIGHALARAIYADLKALKAGIQLTLPYRDDLMPGTIVSVVSTGAEDMGFIGDTLYGMISSTVITCDMTGDNGTLTTSINVVSVRNSADNQNDNLTLSEHPLYESPWVGIDIAGNLLEDPGSVNQPPVAVDKANVNNRVVAKNAVTNVGQQ